MDKIKWLYIGDNARLGVHDKDIYIEWYVKELKEYNNIIDLINFYIDYKNYIT